MRVALRDWRAARKLPWNDKTQTNRPINSAIWLNDIHTNKGETGTGKRGMGRGKEGG